MVAPVALAALSAFGGGGKGGGGGFKPPDISSRAESTATSGNAPVNVAINVPVKKERNRELLAGAGLFLGGIVVAGLLNRLVR